MINIKNKEDCSGCYACASICPKKCIEMKPDEEGFLYPQVNEKECINCNLCEKICPIINKQSTENEPVAYAAYNKNEEIRMKSSSGGIFYILATYVLDRNGVVFGCALNEDLEAVHKSIEKIEDLAELQASKYVQSRIENTYLEAKKFLDSGKLVLYTGTPCQIEGLLSFLNKPYKNLITQDIICHGVPSPLVWKKYIELHEKINDSKVKDAYFRSKISGWNLFSMRLIYDNGIDYHKTIRDDPFMIAFLQDMCLRPSCYNCSFKKKIRPSDFTLADFWSVENVIPGIDDDKGISLIYLNSQTAKSIFHEIEEQINYQEVNINVSDKYNTAMTKSVYRDITRDRFMKYIITKPFDIALNKTLHPSLTSRVLEKGKKILLSISK